MVAAEETAPESKLEIVKYSVTDAAIADLRVKYAGLKITDAPSYETVRIAIADLRGKRTGVEDARLEFGRKVLAVKKQADDRAKEIIASLIEIETPLKTEKDRVDDEKARVKAEKERVEKARVDAIRARIESIRTTGIATPDVAAEALRDRFLNLFEIDIDDSFQKFKVEAQAAKDSSIALLKEAIAKREAWEKEEADRKVEAERLEKIRKDQEAERKALDAARKADEEKARLEREYLESERKKIEAEKAAIEAEKKAEADAKAKAEREAKEAEEKKEREAREAKEKAEAEQKKKSYLEQDKEKLFAFAHDLGEVQAPVLNTEASNVILSDASKAIRGVIAMIRKEADKL